MHKWSEKAKRQMLEKQMTPGARAKREPKNPQQDYESTIYYIDDDTYGFPAAAFKAAIVGACRHYEGLPMTVAKLVIRVDGEGDEQLVRINGTPRMREDMVRLETGVADIRYRAGFTKWSADLHIRFSESMLSLDGLINLVEAAGVLGGVGEWRPSSPKSVSGTFGCFEVMRGAVESDT
jgi:hypothetical protein